MQAFHSNSIRYTFVAKTITLGVGAQFKSNGAYCEMQTTALAIVF
jgi:hypothetical protein